MNRELYRLLGITLVGCLALYPACIYSNWRFRDTNPFTEILTYFYELQGEVKALNASYFELQAKVDSLNASLSELQNSLFDGMNVTVTNFPLDEQGNLKVNITEKPQQTYKDAVTITILDWTARNYVIGTQPMDYGLLFYPSTIIDFPFAFTPKGILLNVTSFWISLTVTTASGTGTHSFKAKINNNFTITFDDIWVTSDYLRLCARYLENNPNLNTIESGLNLLQIHDLTGSYDLLLYRITVFIEYEYQA